MESFISDYVAEGERGDEPDETDNSDDDNSVFNESNEEDKDEDDEEISLTNSSSDLDFSQTKTDFGDKIRIQATKEELTDAFKQKLEILQSEKKWFRKACELKRTIGDAIKVLREVYKGFSSTLGDLPKASLNEFRIELGKILSGTKLVRKFCNVVCKMYPRGYRHDKDYLYVDFENAFDLLIGLSDASAAVSQEVASQEVFLDNLFQMMEYTHGQMLNEALCTADAELQKKAFECLHNLAIDHRNYQKLRAMNLVDMIVSHFENESESHDDNKMPAGIVLHAFSALAALIDERESEAGGRQTEVVGFFKGKLKESVEEEDDENWSPRKIVRTIRRLAQNDCYKKAFGRCNILPLLVEVAKRDSIRGQRESTGAIWALSFIEENQKKILENEEAMAILQLKRESSYINISKNCQGTLWNMRNLLSNQRCYRHLVSWSSSIDETQNSPGDTNNNTSGGIMIDNGQHIMISYQWSNQKTLIKIRDALKSQGYNVWLDIYNMSGSTLEAMAEAVEKASVVLICMSQKYKNSPSCRLEAEYAFQQGKTIIPLKMEKGYRADGWLGLLIGTKLFFEFSGKYPFDDKMKDLLRELSNIVPVVEEKKTVTFSGTDQNSCKNGSTTMTLRRQKTEPFISLSQLNALKSAFSLFDYDDSDRLSVSELGDVLRSVGLNPTQAEIDDIMENADCDGNGFIDYSEYISLLKSYMKPQTEIEKELKDSFKLFSRGSGKVNLKQLRLALTKLGERLSDQEAEELFDMMDENEDGVVDIDEFVKHICAR